MGSCEACNIHLATADSYEAHIKGKRHKKNLKLLEDEKNKMKHQAYVSWKKDIDKCHLESFALKFGPIKNIYVNKENRFGIVEFELQGSCSAFLSNDRHVLHDGVEISVNKRVSKKKRTASSSDTAQSSSGIAVLQGHANTSPLKSAKKKARKHENKCLDPKPKFLTKNCIDHVGPSTLNQFPVAPPHSSVSVTATIEMNDDQGMKNTWTLGSVGFKPSDFSPTDGYQKDIELHPLSNQTNQKQEQLTMKARRQHQKPRNVRSEPSASNIPSGTGSDKSSIIKELLKSKNVASQMTKLVETVRLTKADLTKRLNLAGQIRKLASDLPGLKDAQVHLFGSSANGMGIKGCDLDLILNVRSNTEVKKLMKLMRSRLYSSPNLKFKDILVIPSKRCPIIRFYCPSLELKCDLSFNNKLAIRNTEVLKFLGDVVPQFRVLCFVLRKWASSVDVGGNVNGGPKLTHYSLYMLIWFYIRSKLNLPSFEDLSCLQEQKEYIDQWDCSFPFNLPQLFLNNLDSLSLPDLLVGFFDFFKDINFQDHVLCMRSGKMIPFDKLEKHALQKTALMVQDPFLLEHNITQNVTSIVLTRLQNALKEALSICALQAFKSQPKASSEEVPWGIILLLTQRPPVDITISKTRPAKNRVFGFRLNRPLYGRQCLFGGASTNAVNSMENDKVDVGSISNMHTSDEGFVPILVDKIASAIEKVLHDIFLIKIDSVMCCPLSSDDLNTSGRQGKISSTGNSSKTRIINTPIATIANSISSEGSSNLKTSIVTTSSASSITHTSQRPDCKAPIHSTHENSWRPWPIFSTIEQYSQEISNSSLTVETGLGDDEDNVEITENDLGLKSKYINIQPTSSGTERVFDEVKTSEMRYNECQRDIIEIESDESEDANINNSNENADTEDELWRIHQFHDIEHIKDDGSEKVGNENQDQMTSNPFTDKLLESQAISSETSRKGQHLQGYMLQFDCQSTARTWIGRHKYKHHASHIKDSTEKEIFMTQKMSELRKTGSGRNPNKNDEMEGCTFPFDVKIIVKPVNANLNSQTVVLFEVTPGEAFTKSLNIDFNNFMNCFVNIAKNTLTAFT